MSTNIPLSEKLLRLFGSDWQTPLSEPLTSEAYPPFYAETVLRSLDWREVDQEVLLTVPAALIDLNPKWFAYYSPLVFTIALSECESRPTCYSQSIPEVYRSPTEWSTTLALLIPGSMFEGCFRIDGRSILNFEQSKCFVDIARKLDRDGYTIYDSDLDGQFETKLSMFLDLN